MESRAATRVQATSSSASWVAGLIGFILSFLGLVLCALLAFGLLALPVLDPLGMYSYIGWHQLDLLALVIGTLGPIPAMVGVVLGWWARRSGRRSGSSTRLATAALVLGLVALALTAVSFAMNEYVARYGHLL